MVGFLNIFMVKVILFDADGVLINKPKVFSQAFSDEFGVPMEKILPFFENEFQYCITGKADTKEVIAKYLEDWNWHKSVDEMLNYWHESEAYCDMQLLASVKNLNDLGIQCAVASNQEKYRGNYIKNEMEIGKYFKKFFYSYDIGYSKPDVRFFETVYSNYSELPKDQILFFDDDITNVESAKRFGFKAEFYSTFKNYEKALAKYLNE